MRNPNVINEIMNNPIVKAMLEQASPEEKEEGMRMIKEVSTTIQGKISTMMPALDSMNPTQLEKLLREQT
jgi:hypothetical protein